MKKSLFFLLSFLLLFSLSCKSDSNSSVVDKVENSIETTVKDLKVVETEPDIVVKSNTSNVKIDNSTGSITNPDHKGKIKATNTTIKQGETNSETNKIEYIKENVNTDKETSTNNTTRLPVDPVNNETKVKSKKETTASTIIESKPTKTIIEPIAEETTSKPAKPEVIDQMIGAPNHRIFDQLLQSAVSAAGVVDYAKLKSQELKLDKYLKILESSRPGSNWTDDENLAFWINAYNAFTIKMILNNYPVEKITDLHGGKPWDKKWISINGKTLSLNNIENDIIRPTYREPRIHFAVNCAAKSCPPLLNKAFTPSNLKTQLESQAKKFINNPKLNTLEKNQIEVSKIFEWYGVDFGEIPSYISKYANTTVKSNAKVTFKKYDWALNGK
ncbi:MAG: DUF547 domain-containing protein [Saprospiraceae bacterium]